MTCWLYQMDAKLWPQERYRAEVWEANIITIWKVGKITPTGGIPHPGDIVVLFYVEANTADPGIYGWGIVSWCDGIEINFRPTSPSDYLKMNPAWNDEIKDIISQIRGKMSMGTMWEIDIKLVKDLRQKISQFVYGTT
jgi:hypothetical protein